MNRPVCRNVNNVRNSDWVVAQPVPAGHKDRIDTLHAGGAVLEVLHVGQRGDDAAVGGVLCVGLHNAQ